jgi:hypothetical protein
VRNGGEDAIKRLSDSTPEIGRNHIRQVSLSYHCHSFTAAGSPGELHRKKGQGSEKEEVPLQSSSANGITSSSRTGWDSNSRYAINVHTLSRLESIGRDSDKMSSFHYDGPRNVLCTPAAMSRDVRIQPTPEPTPIGPPAPEAGTLSITLRQIAEVHRGIRASVPDSSDIHAILYRKKRVKKRVIARAPISDGRIRRLWRSSDLTLIRQLHTNMK